ncbi:MAG: bifunctional serine/threonine-protein kinase/formylglycine-generating enzyme family protein [Verrucomicrobiota bacterium]
MPPEETSHTPVSAGVGIFGPASGVPLPEGELLFGRYRYIRELGRGGMGLVLLAHDGELGIDIALKLVPDLLVNDPEAMGELKNEVLRGMVLTHPGIVHTYGFARDSSMAAIIMEFVDGGNFTELKVAQPGGCFDATDLLPWLEQLWPVLDYAHFEVRIGHRDLKPRNLMYTPSGRIKIADFGISSTINDTVTRVSMRNASSGTPAYMSPQQVMGERTSHLDDIYALGATIYELLTGKPPFYKGQILAQVLDSVAPPMNIRREELGITGKTAIPQAWEETVAACLAKEPSRRPQSAGEVIGRLNGAVMDARPAVSKPDKKPARRSYGSVWIAATAVVLAACAWMVFVKRQVPTPRRALQGPSVPPTPAPSRPLITSAWELPPARAGESYRFTFEAAGGASPLGWSPDSGAPPEGLTLDKQGLLAGTPAEAGERTFGIKVTDGDGLSESKAFHLVILSKPRPPPVEPIPEVAVTPPTAPVEPAAKPEPPLPKASKEFPFPNSLDMKFVPVGAPDVLFSIWHTRVMDFQKFVLETGYDAKKGVYSVKKGGKAEFQLFGNDWENPGFFQTPMHPVCGVSWDDATEFCNWLTKYELSKNALPEGFVYRLPTDAEWRTSFVLKDRPPHAPKILRFPWGTDWDSGPPLGYNLARSELPVGWPRVAGPPDDFPHTSAVDAFVPNRFGIYDIAGNLRQFCNDGPDPGGNKYWLRGGSWADAKKEVLDIDSKISTRSPSFRQVDAGFRCVIARKK